MVEDWEFNPSFQKEGLMEGGKAGEKMNALSHTDIK